MLLESIVGRSLTRWRSVRIVTPNPCVVSKRFTADLQRLADWLASCQVQTVAMEATGVYWIPLYELLEDRGFEVILVNARHVKNVPGRKTDVVDYQWIQELHSYGLLRGSFRPAAEIATLRAYLRHRDKLVQNMGTMSAGCRKRWWR